MSSSTPTPTSTLVSDTRVQLIRIVDGNHLGSFGIVPGGDILKWMDITACASAEKYAGESCVTLIMDDLTFPTSSDSIFKIGELIIVMAQVNRSFSSSMEVGVKVICEDLLTGMQRNACSAYFMFVLSKSKIESGTKKTLPLLVPQTEEDHRRYDQAQDRREMRLEREKTINAEITTSDSNITSLVPETDIPKKSQEYCITQFTELILPIHANHMSILFGGQAMAWMEQASYIAATRHAHVPLHISSVDYIHFHKPAFVGDRVVVKAVVTHVFSGNHIEVMVHVKKQGIVNDDLKLTAFFIYTSHQPTIPLLLPLPEYEHELERAFGREKIRLRRQILRNPTETLAIKWTKDFTQELFLRQLISKNIESLLKLNESARTWNLLKKTEIMAITASVISNNVTGFAIYGIVNEDPETVFNVLNDPEQRCKWDKQYRGGSILEALDSRNSIVRMFWKPDKSNMQEMVLLRSWKRKYAGKEYIIANVSIDYTPSTVVSPAQEERKGEEESTVSRSEILNSGYILEKIAHKKTRFISIFQFGGKALSIALSDLVDKHGHLEIAVVNLKRLVEGDSKE